MCPPRVSLIFKKTVLNFWTALCIYTCKTVLCMPELLDGVDRYVTSRQTMKPPLLQCSVLWYKIPCTMNVPNTPSQYTTNVGLELFQKFKIQNMLTFCVSPSRNKIATKCIVKYFCYDPQKFFFNVITSHWYVMLKQKHVIVSIAMSTFRNTSLL